MDIDLAATGPDVAIVGAARCGTSYLAAQLGAHPDIDAPAIKEPNYFSRHLDRGDGWYAGLFPERPATRLRLDASVSYTFPHFPDALDALHEASPHALVVYVVRSPVERALSHYHLHRHYFTNEKAETFGAAIAANPVYLGASDFGHWLDHITKVFSEDHVLVVPFAALTADDGMVFAEICRRLGIPSHDAAADGGARSHRNDVVAFRSGLARRITKKVKHNRAYPRLRSLVGVERIRKIRSRLTRPAPKFTLEQALASCSEEQLRGLTELEERSVAAVATYLRDQDRRTGLAWADHWAETSKA